MNISFLKIGERGDPGLPGTGTFYVSFSVYTFESKIRIDYKTVFFCCVPFQMEYQVNEL